MGGPLKILIIHFRSAPARCFQENRVNVDPLDSAGTDGVSLEIAKRRSLLEAMGHEVDICSAYDWADYPVPDLEFDRVEVAGMVRDLFGPRMVESADEIDLKKAFNSSCLALRKQFDKVIDDSTPDLLFVHNMLCLPVHPAATVSLIELIRERRLPCVAIHHDVLSEGAYKFNPTCGFAESILKKYYPPQMPNLSHWTINTRNRKALAKRGVDARIIHDSMNFNDKLDHGERVRIRGLLRGKYDIEANDIVLLVAARIVPNKQIELAGRLTAVLQSISQEVIGRKLYHGGEFTGTGRIVLVLAGRPERSFLDYQKSLFTLFDGLGINWIYVGEAVRAYRSEGEGVFALYPDMYSIADFVLYPTGWEGFGNQLIEAFAAELPVVVFEYPVFQEDIAPKGVQVVSLGDSLSSPEAGPGLVDVNRNVLQNAANEIVRILTDPGEYRRIVDHNVAVSKRFFGFNVLRNHLNDAMQWATSLKS